MKENWWIKFFENNFSNLYLKKDERTLCEISGFLRKKLKIKKDDLLFDQCCGIGDISIFLSKNFGIKTIGIDQSKEYISKAIETTSKDNLPCSFYNKDAYRFVTPTQCDAAINWYTSFGYSKYDKENLKMLKNSYLSLKSGGMFALDYYNFMNILKNFQNTMIDLKQNGDITTIVVKKSKILPKDGMLFSEWSYTTKQKTVSFGGQTKIYLPHQIKELLIDAGFKKIDLYGSIKGEKLNVNSPRCIAIATK